MNNTTAEPIEQESMEYDVVVVGGGPAGLSAAIRIKQLAQAENKELSVCVLEKASEIGAHILSGAIMDPTALNELIPNWGEQSAPLHTSVSNDMVMMLYEKKHIAIPKWAVPKTMQNDGNYIVRLGNVVKWLGVQAENLGVDIFAGFAGAELCLNKDGAICGVITGDMGVDKEGNRGANFQPGMKIIGKYTVLAEGCRGHLGKQVERLFKLRDTDTNASFALGIKELWEIPKDAKAAKHFKKGLVIHTVGFPMPNDTYGGGFVYHMEETEEQSLIAIGLVVGLGYKNPYLSPYEEFQKYKLHPSIKRYIEGGKRLAYGARAISAGGLPSLPRFVFPGGVLIGDNAGFLNPARIKGSHAAIKTGKLAAEAIFSAIKDNRKEDTVHAFSESFEKSWLKKELYLARNFKPYFKYGLWAGGLLFAIDQLLGGKVPWSLKNKADHLQLKPAKKSSPISYEKPDGVITFDRLSSVFLSNTNHEENQPCHLQLGDSATPIKVNLRVYDAPEQRYCPAGVYEIIQGTDGAHLQINAQNCVHCKSCDIKDPSQNINWVAPQGGEGPIYQGM